MLLKRKGEIHFFVAVVLMLVPLGLSTAVFAQVNVNVTQWGSPKKEYYKKGEKPDKVKWDGLTEPMLGIQLTQGKQWFYRWNNQTNEVTVVSVDVTVYGHSEITLPEEKPQDLIDHENGHDKLAKDEYEKVARAKIEKEFQGCVGSKFVGEGNTPAEREEKAAQKAEADFNRRMAAAHKAIKQQVQHLFDDYDGFTNHGIGVDAGHPNAVGTDEGIKKTLEQRDKPPPAGKEPKKPDKTDDSTGESEDSGLNFDSDQQHLVFCNPMPITYTGNPSDSILGLGQVRVGAMIPIGVLDNGAIWISDANVQIINGTTGELLMNSFLFEVAYMPSTDPDYIGMIQGYLDIPPDWADGINNTIDSNFLSAMQAARDANAMTTMWFYCDQALFDANGRCIIPEEGVFGSVVLGIGDPNEAHNPSPVNTAIYFYKDAGTTGTLTWNAGDGGTKHELYFSDNFEDVNSRQAAAYKGRLTSPSWVYGSPTILKFNTYYYWRVDENNDSNSITAYGPIWTFHTVGGYANTPIPYSGQFNYPLPYNVPLMLKWRDGDVSGITHDVYFGISSADVSSSDRSGAVYKGNQAIGTTTYTPNGILLDKRYYWRIDEVRTYPTKQRGSLWTFTTPPIYYADDFQLFSSTTALKNAWKGTGTANNSWVYQYVDGTDKAVKFWYDNATSPYYSGIKCSVVAAQGTSRDYTFGGSGKTLRVSYKADPNTNYVYMKLWSGASKSSEKVASVAGYEDGNWYDAWFKLNDFGPVATDVTAIEIGEGNDTIGSGQGFLYIDDIRVQATEYTSELLGDISVNHKVDYNDIDTLPDTWLALQVNLVKNSGMNQGPSTVDPNWPKYWYLWNDTSSSEGAYVLHIDNTDPTNLTKPCARLDLDGPTTRWRNEGAICQTIDVNDYNGQDLLVSFMHKGDITAQSDTIFEYRPVMDGFSTNDKAGPPLLKRVQLGGGITCDDCFGALRWDWEPYTHIMTVNTAQLDDHGQNCRYLHLHFRLGGRPTSEAYPEQYLKIDTVTVAPVGSTIPVGDINLDDKVDMADFAALANNWLKTQPSIP